MMQTRGISGYGLWCCTTMLRRNNDGLSVVLSNYDKLGNGVVMEEGKIKYFFWWLDLAFDEKK